MLVKTKKEHEYAYETVVRIKIDDTEYLVRKTKFGKLEIQKIGSPIVVEQFTENIIRLN
jgi:hypothetical protein